MTLESAIKHCEEVADVCEYEASKYDMTDAYESHVACQEGKCGEEHRQLAEWLKELKQLREQTWSLDDAREDFLYDVYKTLESLPTNDEANRIIDSFDRVTSGIRCDDAISRQQAIEKMQELEDEDIEAYGCAIPEGFDGERAIEALNTLPSIQPIAKMVDPQESEAEYRLPDERDIIVSPIINGYASERERSNRE